MPWHAHFTFRPLQTSPLVLSPRRLHEEKELSFLAVLNNNTYVLRGPHAVTLSYFHFRWHLKLMSKTPMDQRRWNPLRGMEARVIYRA